MKKVIVVDLDNKYEYVNKYDDNRINESLIKYLLNSVDDLKKDIILKVNFNYNSGYNQEQEIVEMFKKDFFDNMTNVDVELRKMRLKELFLIFLGFIFLIIYCFLDKYSIFLFSEFFLVISWVVFWEMFESWLFKRNTMKKNKLKYQKLLLAEFEINI